MALITSKSIREHQLKMAEMMRDEARKGKWSSEIANMDLDEIIELHTEAMKRMGYIPKKPHN
jgi:hypothetical protein